jgi:hypothetical protein
VLGPLGRDDDVRTHTAAIAELLAKHQHAGGASERAMIEEAEGRQEEQAQVQPQGNEPRQAVGIEAEPVIGSGGPLA